MTIWIVFRKIPGEQVELRSAWDTRQKAEKAAQLERYRVRDLEGYEGAECSLVEYVPAKESE